MSISAAVGAPAPITIGDKTFTASPVELYDLGAIEESVKSEIMANAARAAVNQPDDVRELLMRDATARALCISYYSREVKAYLASFNGAVGLIVASVRFKHPDVDAAAVGRVLTKNPSQMNAAIDTVSRISGYTSDGKKTEGPAPGEGEQGG